MRDRFNPEVPYSVLTAPRDSRLKAARVSEGTRNALAQRQRADYEGLEGQARWDTIRAGEEGTGGDVGRAMDRQRCAEKQAEYARQIADEVATETGYAKGGLVKKSGAKKMAKGGMMISPRKKMAMGLKKSGSVKKMAKGGCVTKKAKGGMVRKGGK